MYRPNKCASICDNTHQKNATCNSAGSLKKKKKNRKAYRNSLFATFTFERNPSNSNDIIKHQNTELFIPWFFSLFSNEILRTEIQLKREQ